MAGGVRLPCHSVPSHPVSCSPVHLSPHKKCGVYNPARCPKLGPPRLPPSPARARMSIPHYDLIVIGSGPAGEKGAAQAAYFGKRVALIERESVLGGAAANTGTLPSKTLRETALYLSGFRQRGLYGVSMKLKEKVTARDFLFRERQVQHTEHLRIIANLRRHQIDLFNGHASFVDAHAVQLENRGATPVMLT